MPDVILTAGRSSAGPCASAIELAGDKLAARAAAPRAAVPVLRGGEAPSPERARALASEIGYPVLVKAAGGGGGRGIKRVADEGKLDGLLAFHQLARAKGLPAGAPREFDAAYYRHQLPGGMVTTTRRMLTEMRRPELFDAVLEEVTRVRAEMGYPIIVTPVSQFIASQAAHNVIDGERWRSVSDETVRYFLGHYGEPPAPVDPAIADRVLARPEVAKLGELAPLSLGGARERFGARISDEELLLRLTMPAEQVDAMIAARDAGGGGNGGGSRPLPAARPGRSPLVTLLRELQQRESIRSAEIVSGSDRVVWRRA